MANMLDRIDRADLVAALVLVWAMLLAAWPPSAGILQSIESMLGSLAGAGSENLPRPLWAWPFEGLLIAVLGIGTMLWGRGQPAFTTLALATAVALALLGLDVVLRAAQLVSLQLVAPALTAVAAAGLCAALAERREQRALAAHALGEQAAQPASPVPPPVVARAKPERSPAAATSNDSVLARARIAVKQGEFSTAWRLMREAPTTRESFETLYAIGVEFQRQGQRREAVAALQRLRDRDPDYLDVAKRLADLERPTASAAGPANTGPSSARSKPATSRSQDNGASPRKPGSAAAGAQTSQPANLVEGQPSALGRYEVVRELGRGAMGVVYLGRDPKINRVVAIKVIPLAEEFEPDDLDDAKARFFREAETAGRLNHPNIVTIYDVGEERDLAYIAMEYLEGTHLSGHVKPDTLLPMPVVVDLAGRVADALGYAHRENVVHRDIKPANIMYDRNTDALKITDFGIARLTDSSRTRTGIVLGTPSFMSPEQLEGKQVTGQSDLFSLGVSLYQLLTGQLPFRGSSMPKLMFAIANLAHAPVTHVRPELPEDLNRIVDMALAKDPRERYPTGAHMAQALRAFSARLGR
ncbi:MAG: protein kinase [Gammaproteobacteria bacterium]|nr:protein kinase [Gammaproteobacteria bacterium]